jgi:hypothetical protein
MKGVGYPVLGVANNGQRKIMLPGAEYTFPGADYVDEYPQMRKGGAKKKKTKSLSGTNKLFLKHPLFENYKNKVYDPTVDYYQKGGMKTVKSKDGTVTNRYVNAVGDEVVQVKTKDGKYYEKVIPRIQQQKALRDIEDIVKVPFHMETEAEYDKLPADEKLRRFERTVDVNLGYPQARAAQVAKDVTDPDSDPVDNIRHPFAGRYTAEAAYNARKKNASWAPDWLNKAGAWVDANALGVGHEATTLFKDKRPWSTKLRESAEDIYNNAVGVNVGLSNKSEKEKDRILINKSRYNQIPDGFGEEHPFQLSNPKWTDPYDKKQDGGEKSWTEEEWTAYEKAKEDAGYQKTLVEEPKYFDEGMQFVRDWHNSPMYNQMVLNSHKGNKKSADYLTKLRKENIDSIPPLNVKRNAASIDNVAAWSIPETGQVEVFPSGFGRGPSLYVHEILHSSDRPRELYNWDHPAYKKHKPSQYINSKEWKNVLGRNNSWTVDKKGNVIDLPDWMIYNDPRFPNENAVWHDRVMPTSDQRYISSHRGANWKDNEAYKLNRTKNPEYYKTLSDEEIRKQLEEDGISKDDPHYLRDFNYLKKSNREEQERINKEEKENWKDNGHDYISIPTEVRARLGEIRYNAKKERIYDPFTEQITPEIFQQYINADRERSIEGNEPMIPINDLRNEFTDEEILWMLQNISKNENPNKELDRAKKGGFIELDLTQKEIDEYRKGGYIVEDISVPELNQAQKGKTVKNNVLEISDPKEFAYRKAMYDDSLQLHKQALKQTNFGLKEINKEKYEEIGNWQKQQPNYAFADKEYKKDLKNKKVKDFDDYVFDIHDPKNKKRTDEHFTEITDNVNDFAITLSDGSIKTPSHIWNGKPDFDYYDIYNPKTGTIKGYYGKQLQYIANDHMKPEKITYYGADKPDYSDVISTESVSKEYANKVLKNSKSKNKKYVSPFWMSSQKPFYKKPTQPVKFNKNAEKPVVIDKEPVVNKPIVNKSKTKDSKIINKSNTTNYPKGYQPYSIYGRVLDPEVYGYAESLNSRPVELPQFADTYGAKTKMDEYKKSGKYPWVKQDGGITQAQKGIISTKEYTDKKGNKTIKVRKEDGTVYTKVIGKDGKVFNKTFDPKKDSWLTEQTKNLYSKPQGAGNSDWFWAPAALTAIGAAPLIKSGATALGEGLVGVGDAVANATLNKLGKNSFLQATKAAYNAAPSWLPTGASASNLLGATGAAYGVDAYLDKESDVSKANKAAIDNPNFNTVTNAVSENVLNLANFLGIGAGDKIGKTIKHAKNLMPGKKSKTIDDLISKVEELRNGSGSIEEAEKTFEKIKKQSLDFWKTPEGERRVKKYLAENDLSKYGITPQMYSDMMSDIKFLDQPTILNAREKVAKINQSRDILNKEKFKISDKIWELRANRNKLTDLNNPSTQDLKAIEDIDNELQKLENEMSFNSSQDADYMEMKLKTHNVDKSTGYYDSNKDIIFTGEDWSQPANREQTLYHEWGHSKNLKPHYTLEKWFPGTYKIDPITKKAEDFGKVSPINKRLRSGLEFEKQNSSGIPEHLANKLNLDELYENAQGISELGLQRYTDPKSYYQKAHNYFHESDESNAFLQELLPELKKRGYLNKPGDLISPQMVEDLFKEYRQESAKKIVEPLRILDIARPTERTVNKITDELNNLHSLLIGAGGAGAAGATLSDDDESKPELKKGGVVTELSDDEIQDYINQGYIVEEVEHPEMQVGGESDLDSQIEAYRQKLELIKSRRAQNPIQETVVETPVKAALVPSSNSSVQQVVVKKPVIKETVKLKKENPIVKTFEKSKIKQEVKVKTEDTKQKLDKFTKDTLAKIKSQITPTVVPEPNIVNMYKNNYQKHLNSIITDPSKSENLFNNTQLEKEILDRQYIDNVRYGRFDKRGDDVMNRTDFKRNVDSEKYLADIAEDNSVIIDIGSALGNNDPKLSGVSVFELASNPKIKQKNVHVIATDIASGVKDFKTHVKNKTAYDIDYAEVPMNFKTPISKILKDKKLSDKENIYLRTANSIDLLMNVEQAKEHLNHIAKSLKGKTVTYLYNNVILYKPKGKTTFQKLGNINNAGFDHDNKSWLINKNRTPYKLTKPPLR